MNIIEIENTLYSDVKATIEQSRQRVAATFGAELALLYWNVGHRLKNDVLGNGCAEYSERILDNLSERLGIEYGKGWSHKQLRHCIQLSSIFPDEEIFSALRRKLNWTSIKTVMYIDDPLEAKLRQSIERAKYRLEQAENGNALPDQAK